MPAMNTPLDLSPLLLKKQHQWPMIARDIALMSQPQSGTVYTASDIAKSYDIPAEDFVHLMKLPVFVDLVKSEMARLRELGPFASYRIRTESLVSDLQERLYLRAQSGEMEDKAMLQLLSILMRSAGMDAPVENKSEGGNVNQTAVNISFNIPKLPTNKKLAHIMAQPQTNVIDYTE